MVEISWYIVISLPTVLAIAPLTLPAECVAGLPWSVASLPPSGTGYASLEPRQSGSDSLLLSFPPFLGTHHVPNKRSRGYILGGKIEIAPIFCNNTEESGALSIKLNVIFPIDK